MEVLKLLCDGLSPKEIADKLFLSHRTVETHKNNIMQKFEVNSVAKLISIAIKNRIV
jgi:DNA-binding NarL/FixJ family response regulator